MSKQAHILAIHKGSVPSIIGGGVQSMFTGNAYAIAEQAQIWVAPRPHLENDQNFAQIIPYVVFENNGKILAYIRTSAGNETRLHNKLSIGIGGHVDAIDSHIDGNTGVISLLDTLEKSARREIMEELAVSEEDANRLEFSWTHLIHSNETEVDGLHMGFVAVVDITLMPEIIDYAQIEDAIGQVHWLDIDEIKQLTAPDTANTSAETWTRIILDRLNIKPAASQERIKAARAA